LIRDNSYQAENLIVILLYTEFDKEDKNIFSLNINRIIEYHLSHNALYRVCAQLYSAKVVRHTKIKLEITHEDHEKNCSVAN